MSLTLQTDGTGWAKTQWFGMKFDADYADYLSTGNTNASTSEHVAWQTCSDWCKAKKQNMLMQEGTVLLDGPTRVWLWPSSGERMICKGQGRNKTNIFSTIQNSTGDLLNNIPIGGQNIDLPGITHWEDFSLLQTGRGDLNGTNGVNGIAAAYAEGLVVKRVDVLKAGNRGVNCEGLGRLKLYELEDVYIKDSWKNGFTAGGFDDTEPCSMKIHNVEVDGWNLIANESGGLVTENVGATVTASTEDVTQYITGYLRLKNGFSQAFKNLSTPIVGNGLISIDNVEIKDFSSFTNSAAVFVGRDIDLNMPRIEINGVVSGGGVLTTDDSNGKITFNTVKVRNAETFDLRARCFINLMGPDFDRRGETTPVASFVSNTAEAPLKGFINGGSIIAQIPMGDLNSNHIDIPLSQYNIDGCSIIETGSRDGEDYFTQTDFTDLRKAWNIDSLPSGWVLLANHTSTLREPTGLRMKNYQTNSDEIIQLDTKVDSGAGLYTIKFKLSEGDTNAIRVYASHGVISNDILFTVTTTTTEIEINNYQFTNDDVTFKIGRDDTMALGTNKVIEYLKIELE